LQHITNTHDLLLCNRSYLMPGGSWASFTSFTPGRQEGLDRQASIGGSRFGIILSATTSGRNKKSFAPRVCLVLCITFHYTTNLEHTSTRRSRNLPFCHLFILHQRSWIGSGNGVGKPSEGGLELAVFHHCSCALFPLQHSRPTWPIPSSTGPTVVVNIPQIHSPSHLEFLHSL
jgi:hypothetical protein